MLLSPIKIYKTQRKTGAIFFQHPDQIKLLIVMPKEEADNDIFINNIQKSTETLGFTSKQKSRSLALLLMKS